VLLALESASWPAERLEMSSAFAEDVAQCKSSSAALEQISDVKSSAAHYFWALDHFRAEQKKALEAEAGGSARRGDAEHVSACIASYRQAWAFLSSWQAVPNAVLLCEAHSILGRSDCRSAGRYRTCHARVGQCRFMSHADVPRTMDRYVQLLEKVLAREDLSPIAKAAWAGFNLLTIHPFQDGNGRLARLLINWVLAHCEVQFPVALCDSDEHRAAWCDALVAGDRRNDNSQPLSGIITQAVARAWRKFEQTLTDAAQKQKAAEECALRAARDCAREKGVCIVCLEEQPNMQALCCGASYHIACMTRWLGSAPEPLCPACRASFPPLPATSLARSSSVELLEATVNEVAIATDLTSQWARLGRSLIEAVFDDNYGRTGVNLREVCAFCTNLRATSCSFGACAVCCGANQRLTGMRCPRHIEVALEANSSDNASSSEGPDGGVTAGVTAGVTEDGPLRGSSLRTRSIPLPQRDVLRPGISPSSGSSELLLHAQEPNADLTVEDDRCAFCNRKRAVDCALGACRSCCLLRPESCSRHWPTPSGPAGRRQEERRNEGQAEATASGTSMCAFCTNRRSPGCRYNACRLCCVAMGPCNWHGTREGRSRTRASQRGPPRGAAAMPSA